MNESTVSGLSVRRLLLGDVTEEESISTLQDGLAPDVADNLLTGASTALRGAARTEVGRAIDAVVKMDTFDAVALGWRKHGLLAEAARRTVASPGSQEVVELASHRITSSYSPNIEVLLDDHRVGQIDVSLKLTANIVGLVGVVTRGRLTSLKSGHIDLSAVLKCQGADVAKGERRIYLASEVSLGDGIQLIDESEVAQTDQDPNPGFQPT